MGRQVSTLAWQPSRVAVRRAPLPASCPAHRIAWWAGCDAGQRWQLVVNVVQQAATAVPAAWPAVLRLTLRVQAVQLCANRGGCQLQGV